MLETMVRNLDEQNHTVYMNVENHLVRIICTPEEDENVFDDIKRMLAGVVINEQDRRIFPKT